MRDNPMYLAFAIVLLMLPVLLFLGWYENRDVVTGAQGPFPAAFGTEAPVAPEHVMRRGTGERALVHGLSVESTADGARAVNLRTGKEYWRYERQDEGSVVMSFDVSGRTVVIAYSDSTLVGVDLRTGKRLWREDLGHGEGFRNVSLGAGQALTAAPGAVRAFDERDGRSLWTAKTPKSCSEVGVYAVYSLPDHVSAVPVLCNVASPDTDKEQYYLLLGVDNRTGKALWQRRISDPKWAVRGDAHTLAAPKPDTDDSPPAVQLLDMSREGAIPRADLDTTAWNPVGAGSGTVLLATDAEGNGDGDHDTVLHAYDTEDGRLAWRLKAPAGQEYGSGVIADGRVYLVRQPLLTEADAKRRVRDAELLVLDADTGRALRTLRLPAMTAPNDDVYFMKLDVHQVTDGALSLSWRELSTDEQLIITD
ncbi:PQQ-binding-like beta-propeller repeat protein [Streptomyces sp. ActVer]|uniref:outer membrane protein assembly factor BamB family protein n=1 Tax=Streptomyces sp. ActVer TaxID=3014558 RepID=UPI0022B36C04|nr:PQQ-binding-like beta-propeller repeat protein [Streptomyces sp. ActVer]MCZ4512994.1 PQQ-binding-like beta-propeller repeat protein [Streptomyces sp. ActVer]